jgi:Flp pilus assembly protein TadG
MTGGSGLRAFFVGARANSGIAAIEFSFIMPVLLLLVLGVVDICRALIAYRNIAQMTQSLAWATKATLIPATSKQPASLPGSANNVLSNVIFVMQGNAAPSDLSVSVRYLVRSMQTSQISDTILYQTQVAPTSDNTAIVTNMKDGDTRLVVQSTYQYRLLFGFVGTNITLSSRYSI